ncbi:hypothetical protein BCR44DRAFT_1443549 [Catenaria anguillulae PL171]|uniref:Uncharacterized protein n=1 Tax=Catenaria anguillulae PL171 TaxID=765915 RepID=A0A1Y2H8Q0_9FUNG|nr:hypothetical protein BCR44DRAFT_1443549 [Catenaria anguillulae PL171]
MPDFVNHRRGRQELGMFVAVSILEHQEPTVLALEDVGINPRKLDFQAATEGGEVQTVTPFEQVGNWVGDRCDERIRGGGDGHDR